MHGVTSEMVTKQGCSKGGHWLGGILSDNRVVRSLLGHLPAVTGCYQESGPRALPESNCHTSSPPIMFPFGVDGTIPNGHEVCHFGIK